MYDTTACRVCTGETGSSQTYGGWKAAFADTLGAETDPPLFMDGGGGPHRDGSGKDTASKLLYTQNIVDDVDRNN